MKRYLTIGLIALFVLSILGNAIQFALLKKKPMVISNGVDSLAIAQKDAQILKLQQDIALSQERDSLLLVIDQQLTVDIEKNEKDLRKNIDRVRGLNGIDATKQLSKNLSESLSYRRGHYRKPIEEPSGFDQ